MENGLDQPECFSMKVKAIRYDSLIKKTYRRITIAKSDEGGKYPLNQLNRKLSPQAA